MKFSGTKMLCAMMMLCLSTSVLTAQSELKDSDRAILGFDFNLKKLRDANMLSGISIDDMLEGKLPNVPRELSPESINRVTGAVQAPKDLESAMGLQGVNSMDELPINFYLRIEFADADAMSSLKDDMEGNNGGTKEENGVTYISPPGGPSNVFGVIRDDKTVEFGTMAYLTCKDRKVYSKGLSKLWNQLTKSDAIRLSFDIAGAQDLVDEALEMGRGQAPPQAMGMFEIVSNMNSLSLGLDLDAKTLFTLLANGKDSESTNALRQGIDGLLGMAKMGAGPGLENAPIPDNVKAVAKEFLASLKATADSKTVSVKIPKPDGMDEAISGLLEQGASDK